MDDFNNKINKENQQSEGEYHYSYNSAPQSGKEEPIFNPYSSTPYDGQTPSPAQKPEKPEKPKKFGLGAVIASALCAAVLCGTISTVGVASYFNSRNSATSASSQSAATAASQSSSATPVTNITVNDQTDNVAVAVAQKASQSVVGIRVTYTAQAQTMFGTTQQEETSEGSGVIYKENGYIMFSAIFAMNPKCWAKCAVQRQKEDKRLLC